MIRKAVMFLVGLALVVSTVYAEPTARVTDGKYAAPTAGVIGGDSIGYGHNHTAPTPRVMGWNSIGYGPERVTIHFSLFCNASQGPNHLDLKWQNGTFSLQTLDTASCSSDSGVFTYTGFGNGRLTLNGGGYAVWTYFTLTNSKDKSAVITIYPTPPFPYYYEIDFSIGLDNINFHDWQNGHQDWQNGHQDWQNGPKIGKMDPR